MTSNVPLAEICHMAKTRCRGGDDPSHLLMREASRGVFIQEWKNEWSSVSNLPKEVSEDHTLKSLSLGGNVSGHGPAVKLRQPQRPPSSLLFLWLHQKNFKNVAQNSRHEIFEVMGKRKWAFSRNRTDPLREEDGVPFLPSIFVGCPGGSFQRGLPRSTCWLDSQQDDSTLSSPHCTWQL